MRGSGKTVAGIVLILLGASVFFGMFGVHLGGIIAFVIAAALIWFGAKKLKAGHTVLGVIALVVGLMMFTGAIPFLISMLVALACIYFGWKLLKKHDHPDPAPAYVGTMHSHHEDVDNKVEDSFETEWKEFLKKHHKDDE